MSKLRTVHIGGFTLIELLVVIAIIAILAAILVPAVSDALLRGRLTQVLSNGKNIYTALFAKEMEDAVFMRMAPYPVLNTGSGVDISNMLFSTSTEYFQWVVTGGVMNVSFSFFAAPGVPPASGTNATSFSAVNNAWCVSSGVGESTADGTPLLFTRNVHLANNKLDDSLTDLSTVMPSTFSGHENTPFLDKAMVVIFKGGAGLSLRSKDLADNFNKVNATNSVIRPGTGY